MGFETEFEEFMPVLVDWQLRTSKDGYAEETFAAATQVRCRIEPNLQHVLSTTGEDVLSTATLYTAGNYGITVHDRITLPDGSKPPIHRVETHWDEEGPHHQRVFLG